MSPYKVEADGGQLPAGGHEVEITKVKDTVSGKGNPMWIIELQDAEGRDATDFIVLTKYWQHRIKELWTSAGLTWPEPGQEVDELKLIGRRVHVTTETGTDQEGKKRAEVLAYGPPGEQLALQPSTDGGDTGISFADLAKPATGDESDVPFRARLGTWEEVKAHERH
jgi:hypothetical protein